MTYTYRCPVDIYETDEAFVIHADLPGVRAEDLTVEVDRDSLLLTGSLPDDKEEKTASWSRRFHLNVPVARDQIAAKLSDGVLLLTLPKTPAAQPKRITVKAA